MKELSLAVSAYFRLRAKLHSVKKKRMRWYGKKKNFISTDLKVSGGSMRMAKNTPS